MVSFFPFNEMLTEWYSPDATSAVSGLQVRVALLIPCVGVDTRLGVVDRAVAVVAKDYIPWIGRYADGLLHPPGEAIGSVVLSALQLGCRAGGAEEKEHRQ